MTLRINLRHPSVARHIYKEHMRRNERLLDDMFENRVVSPAEWESIDAARLRTGGSWTDVKTIRIRQADNVLDDKDFTVLEVNIVNGYVWGVRLLQRGVYPHVLARGPFLMWDMEAFMLWFLDESQPSEGVELYKQVWVKGAWAKAQTSISEITNVFTS
jgi:hypothetical protein